MTLVRSAHPVGRWEGGGRLPKVPLLTVDYHVKFCVKQFGRAYSEHRKFVPRIGLRCCLLSREHYFRRGKLLTLKIPPTMGYPTKFG